ncbi:hypothetical protein BSL78_16305 [Apostichopus japonicus]|uniref:Uncharacterized protein n=1 Tax=Stichopus japonicus TaxID=307972 RepID=A0A2G8KFP4_STIJA|nr:hypothetical protein BSL78_16305 [Apostichopus japonicus]
MGYPNQPQNAVFVNVENDCPFDVAEPGQDNFEIDQEEINDYNNTFLEKMKMQAAMFIGTMLSDRNMTHASIQRVVNAVTDLTSNTLTLLKTRMQSVLTGFDVDLSTPQCERLFSLFEAVENPCLGLETLYKQEKYFEEDFRILKPKTVALGIRYDTITDSDIEGHISVRFCHKNIGNGFRTAACVKMPSPLNESRYFHVTANLSADIMHDILRVSPMEVKLLLSQLILQEHLFELGVLNMRLSNYDYGFVDKGNKPSEITLATLKSLDHGLKQKASQMWCLTRVLPGLLSYPIEEHHQLMRKCYPNVILTPKHHFMVHYPRLLLESGPLVNTWSMRFEAKHLFAKRLANVVCSFKDICFTVASRHQVDHCIRWRAGSCIHAELETGNRHLKATEFRTVQRFCENWGRIARRPA